MVVEARRHGVKCGRRRRVLQTLLHVPTYQQHHIAHRTAIISGAIYGNTIRQCGLAQVMEQWVSVWKLTKPWPCFACIHAVEPEANLALRFGTGVLS